MAHPKSSFFVIIFMLITVGAFMTGLEAQDTEPLLLSVYSNF